MAQQDKSSVSPALTEAHRIKLEAGRRALAEWELENGPLTEAELAEGRARARASLGREPLDPGREQDGVAEMGGVTYDTGALIAAGRSDREMWALHAGYLAEEVVPMVPALVLSEAWRGGAHQASLSLFLRMCDTEPLTEELAREVGELAGKADHDDVVDVSVVEGAIRRGDAIVTSNSIRTRKIAESAGADLNIEFI